MASSFKVMKHIMKILKLIISILTITLIISCQSIDDTLTIITGQVSDDNLSAVELKLKDTILYDSLVNGQFRFVIQTDKGDYVDIKLKNWINLFIENQDSIYIIQNQEKEIKISGIGYEESNYLQQKNILVKELDLDNPRKVDIATFSSSYNTFKDKIDSIKIVRLSLLKEYKSKNPNMNKDFVNNEKQLINYFWIYQSFIYPRMYSLLKKEKPKLPYNYYSFVEVIETNNAPLYRFEEYGLTLNSLLDYRAENAGIVSPSEILKFKYNHAKEIFKNIEIFEDITYRLIRRYINFNGVDNINKIYNDFLSVNTNLYFKNDLTNKYSDWSNLKKGNKAPEFEIEDTKGKTVKLSDFIGSVVYIDCWATFCAPCIAEMPAMIELVNEYKDQGIVFISISVDTEKERWLNKLKELNLNTINLCTGGTNHKFNYDYKAKAFPRYILVDKDGIIIDATADKPSEIIKELENL